MSSSGFARYNFSLAGGGECTADVWAGAEVALIFEVNETANACALQVSQTRKAEILQALDKIYVTFADICGRRLQRMVGGGWQGKLVIEVPVDNAGAGGLAGHGIGGLSIGRGLIEGMVVKWGRGVEQVVYYEMSRNFWKPEWNCKVDWIMDGERENWGWWTVGMCNAMAVIVSQESGCGFWYFGRSVGEFEARMVAELGECWKCGAGFEGWRRSRLMWNVKESVNDLMTGLIVRSYRRFGGRRWINGVFREIERVEDVNESVAGGVEFGKCRDNVYRIWSRAAGSDLRRVFEGELGWEISEVAKQEIGVEYPGVSNMSLGVNDIEMESR